MAAGFGGTTRDINIHRQDALNAVAATVSAASGSA